MANRNPSPENRFKPGVSGNPNGRPKNQDTLKNDLVDALLADFTANGKKVIAKVRRDKPDEYLKVIARVLPKDIDVTHKKGLPDGERKQLVDWLVGKLKTDPKEPTGQTH